VVMMMVHVQVLSFTMMMVHVLLDEGRGSAPYELFQTDFCMSLCHCNSMMHDRLSTQIICMDFNALQFHDARLDVCTNILHETLCHCDFMMHDRMSTQTYVLELNRGVPLHFHDA